MLNRRSTCEASETSAATAMAEPPAAASAWTTASAPAPLMSFTTTCAPSRANRSAIARPIPPAAPVTITVFPDTVPFDVVTGAPAHPERRGSILSPILPDAASPGGHQHAGHAPNHVAGIVADQGCQHEQQGRWSSRAHPAVLQLLPGQVIATRLRDTLMQLVRAKIWLTDANGTEANGRGNWRVQGARYRMSEVSCRV